MVFNSDVDKDEATTQVLDILSNEQIYFTLRGYELVNSMEWMDEMDLGMRWRIW